MTGKSLYIVLLNTKINCEQSKQRVGEILLKTYQNEKSSIPKEIVAQLAMHFKVPQIEQFLDHIKLNINL